jgi:hypothetical protein
MASATVRVTGLRELTRACKKMSGDLDKELRASLLKAAEPVRTTAEGLALGRIRNMPRSPRWAGMRIGATAKGAYMVPRARGGGGSGRPNLKALLLDRSMDPALEQKQSEVMEGVDKMMDDLSRDWAS